MTIGSVIALILTFFFALLASWALLIPFFQGEKQLASSPSDASLKARDLSERKELALAALEQLEQDYLSRRIAEEEYIKTRKELMDDAASFAAKLDDISVKKKKR